jgi:hypothetical protein
VTDPAVRLGRVSVFWLYASAWSRFEYVARVVPPTTTANGSKAVLSCSAVSTLSHASHRIHIKNGQVSGDNQPTAGVTVADSIRPGIRNLAAQAGAYCLA